MRLPGIEPGSQPVSNGIRLDSRTKSFSFGATSFSFPGKRVGVCRAPQTRKVCERLKRKVGLWEGRIMPLDHSRACGTKIVGTAF